MNEEFAEIAACKSKAVRSLRRCAADDMEACIEEMAYALDVLKLDGVSSSTHVGGVYLGDPRFDAWFNEMNRRKVTLFIHPVPPPGIEKVGMTLNPAILEFMFDSTRMATNMVLSGAKKRFSDIKMICTHGAALFRMSHPASAFWNQCSARARIRPTLTGKGSTGGII